MVKVDLYYKDSKGVTLIKEDVNEFQVGNVIFSYLLEHNIAVIEEIRALKNVNNNNETYYTFGSNSDYVLSIYKSGETERMI